MSFTKLRTITENPQGKPVTKNSIVKFKTYPSSSPQSQLTHSGSISQNNFSPQISSLLLNMRQGQQIEVNTHVQLQNQLLIIDLIDVQEGQQFIQNYKQAQILKNKGNQQIKLKNYQKATQFYEQGFRLVQYGSTPQAQAVKISLLSNLTLAYLNTMKYEECIKSCQRYLADTLQPNKKIVFRKASANKNLKRWQQAANDIKLGLQICANDEQGKRDFQILQQAIKKEKKIQSEKQKKVYSKMFG